MLYPEQFIAPKGFEPADTINSNEYTITTQLRFAVYDHRFVYDRDKLIKRYLIVLRDEADNIVKWTDFHRYAAGGKKKTSVSVYSTDKKRCQTAVKLLNYVFFEKYHITKLTDITVEMVQDFLTDYGLCKLPGDDENSHRSEQTVNRCVSHTIDFIERMVNDGQPCRIKVDELYHREKVFSRTRKRYIEKKVPAVKVYYNDRGSKMILRDIPEKAFQILMNEIVENHTNILMLAACGAFAGMRPSECCNVRRVDSALGPGIRFEMWGGEVVNVIIDLSEEKNLRSDLVSVGGIKKERTQRVYPAFVEAFMGCYNVYMTYIEGRPYEEAYGALTNTSFGKAYTYDAYLAEFKQVVAAVIPKMLASDDEKVVHYGQLLLEHNLSPHVFRHWFSVKLTIYGETVSELMHWRGDTSPESALTYISGKSELEKMHNEVCDKLFGYNLWRASKVMGDKE